jgi:hypothetical protein
MRTHQAFGATIVGALLAANLLVIDNIHAATVKWRPPVAKQLTFSSAAGVVGVPVTITCTVGANQELVVDTNTPQGKYLASGRKPSWTLPVQILVNNSQIGKWDDPGLASLASTWKHSATWTPGPAHAGKFVSVDCVLDKDKHIFYSIKTVSFKVLAKPVPRINMKDQPTPNVMPIPGGPRVPQPPSR